jgi:membrane protease YdiL (CAAX protease family)
MAVTAMSVAMAWLYWRTNESLFMTMLMHSAVNNTTGVVPSPQVSAGNPVSLRGSFVAWTTIGLLWLCAIYFLSQMRRARFREVVAKPI